MIVVDTSALAAILFAEVDRERHLRTLRGSARTSMAAAGHLELSIVVLKRFGPAGIDQADKLLSHLKIEVAPVDLDLARLARDAFLRFGRGRHPAGLNFGDCFSYALARARGEPLLFKGDDFRLTDIEAA